eukprot:g14261.t1
MTPRRFSLLRGLGYSVAGLLALRGAPGARAQGSDSCARVTVSAASGQATTIELPASTSEYENQLADDSTVRGQYVNEDEDYFIWYAPGDPTEWTADTPDLSLELCTGSWVLSSYPRGDTFDDTEWYQAGVSDGCAASPEEVTAWQLRTTEETVETELVVDCVETDDGGGDGLSKKTLVVLLIVVGIGFMVLMCLGALACCIHKGSQPPEENIMPPGELPEEGSVIGGKMGEEVKPGLHAHPEVQGAQHPRPENWAPSYTSNRNGAIPTGSRSGPSYQSKNRKSDSIAHSTHADMRLVLGLSALAFVAMEASASSTEAVGSTGAKPSTRHTSPGAGARAAAAAAATAATSASTADGEPDNPDLTSSDTVAFSSRMIAAARALESWRADRLFSDPYAELLAGPDAMQMVEDRRKARAEEAAAASAAAAAGAGDGTAEATTGVATGAEWETRGSERRLAIRTRFCDDFFEDCVGRRGIKQIVSVGAGMDTRGLRLKASEGTKVFEVDQSLVLRVKSALLMAATAADEVAASVAGFRERRDDGVGQARVVSVEADLSVEGWEGELFEAGFDPSQPSAWILEGLTMYLEEEELVNLIRIISKLSTPGSAFCATTVSAESVARARTSTNPLMGTWKWGSDDPQEFFTGTFPKGWSFNGVSCGTPGEFPDGADYGVGFKGKAPAYVFGYLASVVSNRQEL